MIDLLKEDLDRYFVLMGNLSIGKRSVVILSSPGIWIIICFRIGRYLKELSSRRFSLKIVYFPFKLFYGALCVFSGIDLPLDTNIGCGFYIGHHGGIVIHPQTSIGKYCNISHGVTIGEGGRKEKRGVPQIGDSVYIGPGATIFGKIKIENNVAIGANAVVTKSVPANAVMGGVPARILNYNGTSDLIIVRHR